MENDLVERTSHIVSAYVSDNQIELRLLPELIAMVGAAIAQLAAPTPPAVEKPKPAVNPKRSVFPDYIISLEDGRKFKSLRRALMARYGLTPEQYREKWELPSDYPMVAPNYSARRSELAKGIGLGQKAAAKRGSKRRKAQG